MKRLLALRAALVALMLAALFLSSATPVQAHAFLVSADPADGSALTGAPEQARLWFSEPILLKFTTVELVDSDGQSIPLLATRLDGADPSLLIVDLPDLPPNAYRLTWRTLSADDVHVAAGAIVFGLGRAAEVTPASVAVAPSKVEVTLRWLNFTALAGAVGALALIYLILPRAATDREFPGHFQILDAFSASLSSSVRRRLLWLGVCSATAAFLAGLGLLFVQAGEAGGRLSLAGWLGDMWQMVDGTGYGLRWLQRQALLLGLLLAFLFLLRRTTRYAYRQLLKTNYLELLAVAPLALALLFTQALNSHAAGLEEATLLKVSADALHLLSTSLWSGGLLALAVAVLPLLRRSQPESSLARSVLRHFGPLAALSVFVIILTGLYNTGQQVASLDALLVTLYGQSLMLKVGLVLGLGALGLLNSALLHPQVMAVVRLVLRRPPDWSPFAPAQLWPTVLIEATGAAVVLILAALLTAIPPARGPEWDPPSRDELAASTGFTADADDLVISLSIKPNRPGQNFITLGVFNTRRPAPAPIERVVVQLRSPDGMTQSLIIVAKPLTEGRYQITGEAINDAGEWQIAIEVHRSKMAVVKLNLPWVVAQSSSLPPRRPVLISNAPLKGPLTALTILLAGLALGSMIWLWRRWRRATIHLNALIAIRPATRLWLRE